MAKVRMNAKLSKQLARSPGVMKVVQHNAQVVKESAERETPIGDTGDAIHGYVVRHFPVRSRVGNTDFFFHLIEWGSANNPPYAPLRRGVRAVGLRFEAD